MTTTHARDEAVALVQAAVTRQAPERIVLFARKADALLTRHGERRAALACVSAACRACPGRQDLDLLRFGDGPLQAWVIARQHPGETMAEHWMEGFLARMLDDTDPVARRPRATAAARAPR